MDLHPNWKTLECLNVDEGTCNNKGTILYGAICKCYQISVIPACSLHQFLIDSSNRQAICADCLGIKECPECHKIITITYTFNIETNEFIPIDEFDLDFEAKIICQLEADPLKMDKR